MTDVAVPSPSTQASTAQGPDAQHSPDAAPGRRPLRLGVLTSGGDAPGMNAAVRAVARTALSAGAEVYAIREGFQGMIDGGEGISRLDWDDLGSVLNQGGTVIGTFRSVDFRERSGRARAAANLVRHGIDRLVVIGGDGSLSGLDQFQSEWSDLLAELVDAGTVTAEQTAAMPRLHIVGLVGSIDNDLVGTDITIGADSALHRIVDAIDEIASTSASHQRRFVLEVMGRHCGYLALMAAIAGGCDYVFIPELPPADGWEQELCEALDRGRQIGRRESIVVVAEGSQDRHGEPITSQRVADAIKQGSGEEARITVLGHVQRGGTPTAYDRWASTWLGQRAAQHLLDGDDDGEPVVLGMRGNRVNPIPLREAVATTREVPKLIESGDHQRALELRGASFAQMTKVFGQLNGSHLDAAEATAASPGSRPRRVAVMHAGGLAPGMNPAAAAAVRLGISRGHTMIGVKGGFPGLAAGDLAELGWSDVEGWIGEGGAWLGTKRDTPGQGDLPAIARALTEHRIDALLVVGGFDAYEGAVMLHGARERHPELGLPIICVPASIDNNLPGSELSIGADTALNEITTAIDKIKRSGTATKRCFVVETMGRRCGYLALVGGLAGGAERVYTNEDGIRLEDLVEDVQFMVDAFSHGRRIFLVVRGEDANEQYTTDFLVRLYEEAGGDLYDVRQAVLGHVQQGGEPTAFDRSLAVRLVDRALDALDVDEPASSFVGLGANGLQLIALDDFDQMVDPVARRPRQEWWLQLRQVFAAVTDGPR